MWFHIGNYHEMYLRLPMIISNLLDANYFDVWDLKLIEVYDMTDTKATMVYVKATFHI